MKDNTYTILQNHYIEKLQRVSHGSRWTFLVLLSFRKNKTREAFPALDTIVEKSGIGRSNVCKFLNQLEQEKLIIRKKRKNTSTVYIFPDFILEGDTCQNNTCSNDNQHVLKSPPDTCSNDDYTNTLTKTNTNTDDSKESKSESSQNQENQTQSIDDKIADLKQNIEKAQARLKDDKYPDTVNGIKNFWLDTHLVNCQRHAVNHHRANNYIIKLYQCAKGEYRERFYLKHIINFFYEGEYFDSWSNPPPKDLSSVIQHWNKLTRIIEKNELPNEYALTDGYMWMPENPLFLMKRKKEGGWSLCPVEEMKELGLFRPEIN